MSHTPKHYNMATENRPSQDCKKEFGPEVPKTEFGGGGAAKKPSPMGKEKGSSSYRG